ncbi:polysaccharide deacetylase [Breoghania sp. L-A4]|nr:polysaccharide deacetylase [Breoghania sp. L-A4]
MLHRVMPAHDEAFQPNSFLEITPEFLELVIERTRAAGIEFVSIDTACERLKSREFGRRFAVLTFDDGYRDNMEHALPVLKKHGVPFTIYASSGITDGTCELWWIAAERIVAGTDVVEIDFEGHRETLPSASLSEKVAANKRLVEWLGLGLDEHSQRRAIRQLAGEAGIDLDAMCRSLAMDWAELRRMASEPLATIGSHTLNHHAVGRLDHREAARQISEDADRLEAELGSRPQHFAYPYGWPEAAGMRDFGIAARLGFKSAVTTRPGHLFAGHADHMTALPRVSLNGNYQKKRYLKLLISGAPFVLYNRFRRINVT